MKRYLVSLMVITLCVLSITSLAYGDYSTHYSDIDYETMGVVDEIIKEVEGETLLNKLRHYNYWLTSNVKYDAENMIAHKGGRGQTAYEALVLNKTVCAGYARAFELLCKNSGIPCLYVTGTSFGEGHAWNAVWVGDAWLYVDTTWNATGNDSEKYLLMTGSRLESSHVWDADELDIIAHGEYPDLESPSKTKNIIRYDIGKLEGNTLDVTKMIVYMAGGLISTLLIIGIYVTKLKYR